MAALVALSFMISVSFGSAILYGGHNIVLLFTHAFIEPVFFAVKPEDIGHFSTVMIIAANIFIYHYIAAKPYKVL